MDTDPGHSTSVATSTRFLADMRLRCSSAGLVCALPRFFSALLWISPIVAISLTRPFRFAAGSAMLARPRGTAPHPLTACGWRVSWSRAERPGDDGRWSLPARPSQVHAAGQWSVPIARDCRMGTLVPSRVIIVPGLMGRCSWLPRCWWI